MEKLTDIKQWFHVDTLNNPANMITRQILKILLRKMFVDTVKIFGQ